MTAWTVDRVPVHEILPLRHKVLRPNRDFDTCHFPHDNDADTIHFAIYDAAQVVGIATLLNAPFRGQTPARQVRGMAVEPAYRRKAVGLALLDACIAEAETAGVDILWCNARLIAVPFYRRRLFDTVGEQFIIEGIGPHYLMRRRIDSARTPTP